MTCDHSKPIMLDKTGVCSVCGKLVYDEDYFIRGKESGLSLYQDYRWLAQLTIPMVHRMIDHLGIVPEDEILDFACARGYSVKAFRFLGYHAFGNDVSKWAIDNADEEIRQFLIHSGSVPFRVDWIIAKDCLEHIPQVRETIAEMQSAARKGIFAVVPLSAQDGESYVVPDYERDVTHIHRLTLPTWARMFMAAGWTVEASYRVNGVKDNYAKWEHGNGFLTCKRID